MAEICHFYSYLRHLDEIVLDKWLFLDSLFLFRQCCRVALEAAAAEKTDTQKSELCNRTPRGGGADLDVLNCHTGWIGSVYAHGMHSKQLLQMFVHL